MIPKHRPGKLASHKHEELLLLALAIGLLTLTIINFNITTRESINEISGNALSRANISSLRAASCNLTLETGLNLISFFCITYDVPRANLMANFTNLTAIFEYQETNSDKWKSYNPNLPSWVVQDLTTMSRTEGYWLRMNGPENIIIEGGLRVPTNVNLVAGWNLAGYPTNSTKQANDSFISIAGNYTEVRTFNALTQAFISHTPPASGGLIETIPPQGYWINATTSEVWIVD